jgi:D-arginine dehydrogenase
MPVSTPRLTAVAAERYVEAMSSSSSGPRIVVIGGGIAGVSAAYALAEHASQPSVTLIEAEPQLAHHTTGRSAALFIENYGTGPARALTKASRSFFQAPPDGLADAPLLERRGVLSVARPTQDEVFAKTLAQGVAGNPEITEITVDDAVELYPTLRGDRLSRAMYEPEASDIDVGGLHQSFVRGARRSGASIVPSTMAESITADGDGWRIDTTEGPITADLVVNAAGAWGDDVARRAGVEPIGLRPLRRTAFMIDRPESVPGSAPLTADVEHEWYMKPDGVQILCSPADETPSEPCDAKPEEIDIARAIDDLNEATTLNIRSIRSSWAGLRTFSPDDTIVIGPDPGHRSFIWCVGQGGTGIQTSPAAGQLVADLALDGATSLDLDPAAVAPDRFR